MPVAMIFGDPHLEPLAEWVDLFLPGESNPVQMGGHNGVDPEFYLASIGLEGKEIGNVADVFIVPEQDFVMAGDAKVKELFHSYYPFDGKIINCHFCIKA